MKRLKIIILMKMKKRMKMKIIMIVIGILLAFTVILVTAVVHLKKYEILKNINKKL